MKVSKLFILLVVGGVVLGIGACSSLSPSPIAELVGEWQTLDGSETLKINSDGTFTYSGSNFIFNEGTISVSNDYEIYATSKDNKTNTSTYFFIKDNRLFLGAYIREGEGNGIKARWKNEVRIKNEGGETTITTTYQFRDDGKVIVSAFIFTSTNDYELINQTKDIASLVKIGNYTNCYILADWKGKSMMYLVDIDDYDSSVFKKK